MKNLRSFWRWLLYSDAGSYLKYRRAIEVCEGVGEREARWRGCLFDDESVRCDHAPTNHNRSVPAALAAFVLCSFSALAQVSSGTLVGTILDPTGAAIPNAKVEAKNADTGVVSGTAATGSGEYRIGDLIAGNYSITASATGFSGQTLQNVTVDANKIATENLTLAVGLAATRIEVIESEANIDTTTATIENTFDRQMVRDLPVTSIGLGVVNLALLNSGVASNGGIGAGEGPSVGGQRPHNNNFMVDGVDANIKTGAGSLVREYPNDSIAEFAVLQNQEGAQYGHSSGGQFNAILKSGTNAFHGTVYEYLENRNLNAVDQQVSNANIANGVGAGFNPRFDNNRFGGSVGGPILKNKLFFFTLYEYNPVGEPATPSGVSAPTAAGYSILSSMPGLSQTNLGIMKQYLAPASTAVAGDAITVNGQTIPVGPVGINAPFYQNNQAFVQTVDYNISDKDHLRGRYIYNRQSAIDINATLPAFFTSNTDSYHVASLAEYHDFTPSLVSEFRLGFNRIYVPTVAGNFKYPGLDSFPNIDLNDLGVQLGPDPSAPQEAIQNMYQMQDNVTWVKGRHTIQFGMDLRRYISPITFTQRSRGDYEYNSTQLFLQDGTPDYFAQRSLGNPVYYGDQIQSFEYVQDTFKFRPNLTFTAGVRYELTTVPQGERTQILNSIANVPGVLTFGVPQDQKTNFAPRLGVAYSPGSKGTTSIRAGFGMAYDVIYDNIGILALPPQLSTTVDVTGGSATNFLANGGILPNLPVAGSLTPAQARAETAAYIPNQELPYSIQWNIGFQQVFWKDYTFEARYLGTRGVHLDMQDQIVAQSPVTAANSLPTYTSMPSQAALNALPLTLNTLQSEPNLLPLYANAGFTNHALTVDEPYGWSTYNGLALQLNRRFSNGLQFQGAYTWSHLIDNSTADFNTTALTPRRPENSQDLSIDKASSALDRRQRLTLALHYDVPWFKKSNWMMKNLVGNWTVSPIYTYETAEMATVQSGLDSNLNQDSAGDRTIVNPGGVPGTGSGVTALKNSAGQTVAYLANNPSAQYIVAGPGAYANGGRNTLALRPIDNVDLSLYKNFNITERWRMQLGAQFLNFLNHPQFVPGFTDRVDNPTVLNNGPVDRNFLTPGNLLFNNPEAVFSSSPRNIQVSLKLFF